MDKLITEYLLPNWQRKCVALLAAVVIWIFVNHSITGSKIIPNVPIRVINLPADKTISGTVANGILGKRINLTIIGTKDIIEQIEPGDLEILLDASAQPDDWAVELTKKHLISLNPQIDVARHVSQVTHGEFIIKMSRLATTKVPVHVGQPIGLAPRGYEYIDVWPSTLYHTVSGAEEQVKKLHNKGLELVFNLNDVSKSDLDSLYNNSQEDEVSFIVPDKWKTVTLPHQNKVVETINDPEAEKISIHFLRKQLLPLNTYIPIRLFYPLKDIATINPHNLTIASNDIVKTKNGITVLTVPLYASDVSHLFLDVIRHHIEITIRPGIQNKDEKLDWSVEFIDQESLEDAYVAKILAEEEQRNRNQTSKSDVTDANAPDNRYYENYLRERFRDYVQKFALFIAKNHRLELKGHIQENSMYLTLDDS